jgi:hypothetical protein
LGAALSDMTVARCIAKRILATTMIRIPSWQAPHAAIFPCYQTCSMTQKRLGARLSKVLKEEMQS